MTTSSPCIVCELQHCHCGVERQLGRCGGRWTIRGTRIWARTVLHMKADMVMRLYPHINEAQIAEVERWIAGGGRALLAEEEAGEALYDLAHAAELEQLVKVYRAHGLGRAELEKAVADAVAKAWEDEPGEDFR